MGLLLRDEGKQVMEQSLSRNIQLQGPLNFRDLGGYRVRDGQTVRWRKLIRSDAVHSMSPQDSEFVYNTLGVVNIIDLRTPAEVRRDGLADATGYAVRYHHIPFLEHGLGIASIEQDPVARLTGLYLGILREAGGQIARGLDVLAGAGGLPAVFHCSAGKDRAGIMAAMILSLLGLDERQILEDYTVTNQNIEAIVLRIQVLPGNEHMQQRPVEYFHAQPKAMEEFLNALRDEYDGAESYAQAYGVPQCAIDHLRATLLQ